MANQQANTNGYKDDNFALRLPCFLEIEQKIFKLQGKATTKKIKKDAGDVSD